MSPTSGAPEVNSAAGFRCGNSKLQRNGLIDQTMPGIEYQSSRQCRRAAAERSGCVSAKAAFGAGALLATTPLGSGKMEKASCVLKPPQLPAICAAFATQTSEGWGYIFKARRACGVGPPRQVRLKGKRQGSRGRTPF